MEWRSGGSASVLSERAATIIFSFVDCSLSAFAPAACGARGTHEGKSAVHSDLVFAFSFLRRALQPLTSEDLECRGNGRGKPLGKDKQQ